MKKINKSIKLKNSDEMFDKSVFYDNDLSENETYKDDEEIEILSKLEETKIPFAVVHSDVRLKGSDIYSKEYWLIAPSWAYFFLKYEYNILFSCKCIISNVIKSADGGRKNIFYIQGRNHPLVVERNMSVADILYFKENLENYKLDEQFKHGIFYIPKFLPYSIKDFIR